MVIHSCVKWCFSKHNICRIWALRNLSSKNKNFLCLKSFFLSTVVWLTWQFLWPVIQVFKTHLFLFANVERDTRKHRGWQGREEELPSAVCRKMVQSERGKSAQQRDMRLALTVQSQSQTDSERLWIQGLIQHGLLSLPRETTSSKQTCVSLCLWKRGRQREPEANKGCRTLQ